MGNIEKRTKLTREIASQVRIAMGEIAKGFPEADRGVMTAALVTYLADMIVVSMDKESAMLYAEKASNLLKNTIALTPESMFNLVKRLNN